MAVLNLSAILTDFQKNQGAVLHDTFRLMRQFLKSPQSVGILVPSSRELATAMLEPVDFANLSTIIEFGPGTGAITTSIVERLPSTARYIGIELNSEFHKILTTRFPQLTFVNKSADDTEAILKSFGVDRVDAIICGLPWASLPSGVQPAILNAAQRCLKPGGVFITYAYLQGLVLPGAWALRRRLRNRFSSITTTRIVWNNMPPAFAYVCRR